MRILPLSIAVISLSLLACGGSGGSGETDRSSSASSAQTSSESSSQSSAASSVDSQVSGLDERPSNTTCLAGEKPSGDSGVALERAFPDLSFTHPVALLQPPEDNSQWYLLEQAGRIWVFDNDDEVSDARVFADLRERVDDSSNAGESGLLSMAFHPDYAETREVFLFYQVSEDTTPPIQDDCCVSQLVRYRVNDSGTGLEPGSAEVLLSFTAPYSSKNHFGGHLAFDDRGYLYLSIGDGGGAGDPDNRAQNTANVWGSMIRLDVDNGSPYAIPGDNPFADQASFLCDSDQAMAQKQASGGQCPELYAWGLRNPWRWSFDRATGELWLADVGQAEWEEINRIQRGGNYGWNIREGAHCYNASTCETAGLIDPVAELPQPYYRSITGGVVYRGSELPSLVGKYLFGDYVTGRLDTLADDSGTGELRETEPLIESTGLNIASFAQDREGEVYVLDYNGSIHRLVAEEGGEDTGPARWLSETGCVEPDDPRTPAEGLIPYRVNAPFWSDGAAKQRWMALPDAGQITLDADRGWQLPAGSVVLKNFHLQDALIETRLFMHHTDGQWAGYTYAWNPEGTDAKRIDGGQVAEREGQQWIYPSASECLQCHTQAAGRTLGLETAQLNSDLTYPSTGRTADQLDTLLAIGVLAAEPGTGPSAQPLADPYADLGGEAVADQARAYLHTNCAQCHRPDGPTNLDMDLRATTPLPEMHLCEVPVQNGDGDARRLVPGDADASALVSRMALRDHADQMPPIGSAQVDRDGQALLREWINGLAADACP